MTDDNSTLVDMDNLDTFSEAFFGKDKPEPKVEAEVKDDEDSNENGDDTPATETDEDAHSEEEPNDDEDQNDEDKDDKSEPPKRGRKSAKDRIEELYASNKQLQREIAALKSAPSEPKAPTEVEPKKTEVAADADDAPKPDAVDKDGEPLYPLGEFDRNYIRDLTRFTIDQENAKAKVEAAKEAEARKVAALQEELTNSWAEKVNEAEKEIPDLRERLVELEGTFSEINPKYGEYLAATIMSCDNGPSIMYYFSQNIGEAQKIVNSGPAAAALAIGRLDARLASAVKDEEKQNNKRVSGAPNPAQNRTRGSGSRFVVSPDTDDLDAFEREFFKKKSR